MKALSIFLITLHVWGVLTISPSQFSFHSLDLDALQRHWLDQDPSHYGKTKFALPSEDSNPLERAHQIELKRQGYVYGPSLLGNTSYFPTGSLGDAMVQQHVDQWLSDAYWLTTAVEDEFKSASRALNESGGLHSIEDYQALYRGQWSFSVPYGLAPGIISNGTQDLLFSMERLSVNPYTLQRLRPGETRPPFDLDPSISRAISGMDLSELHSSGRLFYVDHSYQATYPVSVGRYTAACSAYFYIHPISGDFLPLAIKTNVGSDLIYTPLDTNNDWLLAKTMFNANDLFHGQIFHLANSHAVTEVVHQAALRTMDDLHPVLGLLNRLIHQAYAIRPVGEKFLFHPDGFFDESFAITNQGVREFATEYYAKVAGAFRSNYFLSDVTSRGLLNCSYGPALKEFPFFEDASVLQSSIHRFMSTFVDSYYDTDTAITQDYELQAWVREATEGASVIDFPDFPIFQKAVLVDILTHVAFLTGVSHHVLNSGEPVGTSGVLPFHPSALYRAPPVGKGVQDLMPYLTPATDAVRHVALFARFNRPELEAKNQTLAHMFLSQTLLNRWPAEIRQAASKFYGELEAFSGRVSSRSFDADGLSQGMPFIWQGLDPRRVPFFLSV